MVDEIKPKSVYTPKEAREYLKVSHSTVKRMLKNGIIKAYKVGGQYRILGSEILKLVSPEFESRVYNVYKRHIKDKIKDTIKKW
jgi:excisionase family DNA binding protein